MTSSTSTTDSTDLVLHALADSAAALDALLSAVGQLTDADLAGPSPLDGWTRGHVLSHVAGIGGAMLGQTQAAERGEVVPVYASQEARNAGIEAGSGRTVAEHLAVLGALGDDLAQAWPEPGSPLWDAPSGYRGGPLSGCLLAWWREVRIHSVDALAGTSPAVGYETWDDTLCVHLRAFLAVRLPDGVSADDIAGDPRDVTAWLAGRVPAAPLGTDLPELGPWPSALPAR
ncbi:maleylpyruvate isomerase N-terminal domain-containing protein [Promicromonospora iranensis]|uniref:Maleylpyruvate isomerase n=1 Tax=Promicromonospora iranensis TaxID=1105144 RepID=A0ABU2CTA7_9MICO|nr:maleylpyruvate isomerase N-terminal domain-containing protein [Promicromonospora iranensis]MDR7384555.1 maleylpyruvate isomerase [Promicromonospora iranensis]